MEAPGRSAQCAGLFIPLVIKHGRRAVLTPCTENAGSSPGPVGMDPGAGASPLLFARDSSPVAGQWAEPPPCPAVPGGRMASLGEARVVFSPDSLWGGARPV